MPSAPPADHAAFSTDQKRMGLGDFTRIPNGTGGLEERQEGAADPLRPGQVELERGPGGGRQPARIVDQAGQLPVPGLHHGGRCAHARLARHVQLHNIQPVRREVELGERLTLSKVFLIIISLVIKKYFVHIYNIVW